MMLRMFLLEEQARGHSEHRDDVGSCRCTTPEASSLGPLRCGERSVHHSPLGSLHAPVISEKLILPFAQRRRIYKRKKASIVPFFASQMSVYKN
jgi:hypothetical protein